MENKVKQYKEYLKKKQAYRHATGVMYYDMETAMPKGGAEDFAKTMGVLSEEIYKMETSEELKALVAELYEHKDELDEITRREVEEHQESIARIACIPMEEYVDYESTVSMASSVWQKAKQENDYKLFEPYLKKLIDYNRKFALYYAPEKDPYDTLLDQYEKGMNREMLDRFFDEIAKAFRPLVEKTAAKRDEIDDSFLFKNYPIDLQDKLSREVMQLMGIDGNYCTLGEVEHPFTDNYSKHDVRITTHYHEDMLASSFYSVVHEGGHALYELNTGDELIGSPLASGASMGMHESQSRLFENIIGRSYAFVKAIYPKILALFPEQLKGITDVDFYRAVNKSVPSLIRTEADELTYCFHVMIRYELEKQLIGGTLSTEELPEKWKELYEKYLGIRPETDTEGCLQDSHWAGGSFGYFPSYAIGSAYGAQIMESMKKDVDVDACVAKGDLSPVNAWITEKIWKYGMLKKPAELIRNACGAAFDPKYYVDYMTKKYNQLYKL